MITELFRKHIWYKPDWYFIQNRFTWALTYIFDISLLVLAQLSGLYILLLLGRLTPLFPFDNYQVEIIRRWGLSLGPPELHVLFMALFIIKDHLAGIIFRGIEINEHDTDLIRRAAKLSCALIPFNDGYILYLHNTKESEQFFTFRQAERRIEILEREARV